jgi:hypothetical protein
VFLFLLIGINCLHSQNYHLKWQNDNKALSKLKNETVFKLEFNLDSCIVDNIPNRDYYESKEPIVKHVMKTTFEEWFNTKAKGKIVVNAKIISGYTYKLKITPIKYNKDISSSADPHKRCSSTYIQGAYFIEVFDTVHIEPLASFKLTNLTNKYPMYSNCGRNKYSNNIDKEINTNLMRAGIETSKYLLKKIRQSPALINKPQ